MVIRAVDGKFGGACHDSHVWNLSAERRLLKQKYENGEKEIWIIERDPTPFFLDTKTQQILKSMSQFQHNKIFRKETGINNGTAYQLMTDVELEEKLHDMIDSARQRLQMTPLMQTLGVWKSQLRTRARRLKMDQRLTGGGPSGKPMSDFEEKALATFGSAAVDGVKTIESVGLELSREKNVKSLPIERPISPTLLNLLPSCSSASLPSPLPSQSPLLSSSPEPSPNPASPPCVNFTPENEVNERTHTMICSDTILQGFSNNNFIVTDVSYGLKTSLEKVFIRQANGYLKNASLGTSKRISQVYFPIIGRNIRVPNMFVNNELEKCLNEKKYEFVLDRLSVQYEPYEKEYHEISGKVYMHINKSAGFECIRSTRHFGPMAFFLAWHKLIDDLLCDMMKRHFLKNCVEIIALMYKLNSIDEDYEDILLQLEELQNFKVFEINDLKNCFDTNPESYKINSNIKTEYDNHLSKGILLKTCIKFIDNYIKKYGHKKVQLKLALDTFKEDK